MKKIILLMTLAFLFCLNGCTSSTMRESLPLPSSEELTSITITKHDVELVYTDPAWINHFLMTLANTETTNIQSVNDQPDVADTYKITFNFNKQTKTDTLYFYEKEDNYYLEQPYQGVYCFSTTPDEFLNISVSNSKAEFVYYKNEQYIVSTLSNKAKQWLDLSEEDKMNALHHPKEIVYGKNMVMVNGIVYIDSREYSSVEARCGVVDGEITTTVQNDQRPKVNDESNFGIGYGYQFGMNENTIEINMNNRWRVFVAEE